MAGAGPDASTDRALVIGCDAYPDLPTGLNLAGAVKDALAMRRWLCTEAGLTPRQVTLLASRAEGSPDIPDRDWDPHRHRAASTTLGREVRSLVTGPAGRRLYVFFAGHGCRTDPVRAYAARDAFLLTDANLENPSVGSVGLDDLEHRLSMVPFREVVLIADACRIAPFTHPFTPAPLGFEVEPSSGSPAPEVFVLQAAAPGQAAYGAAAGTGGPVSGALTAALLDGLRGAGAAKAFDATDTSGHPYRVDWSTLVTYLKDAVRGQTPQARPGGEPRLVLARFPESEFTDVTVTVEVNQGAAPLGEFARLQVRAMWLTGVEAPVPGTCLEAGPSPVTLVVPPRQHKVSASAGRYWASRVLDVYADHRLELTLMPPPDATGAPSGARGLTRDVPTRLTRHLEALRYGPGRDLYVGRDGGTPQLLRPEAVVVCDDPAAVVELRTQSGRLLGRDVQRLAVGLPPGEWCTAIGIGAGGEEVRAPVAAGSRAGEPTVEPTVELTGPLWAGRRSGPDPGRWGSPALRVAGQLDARSPDRSGRPEQGVVAVSLHDGADRATTWVETARPPVHELDVGGVRLSVPVLPDVVTSVVAAADGLCVRLYDLPLLARPSTPPVLLYLDRMQDLLAAGRVDAARLLRGTLTRLAVSSRVVEELARPGSATVGPGVIPGGRPWHVTVVPSPQPS